MSKNTRKLIYLIVLVFFFGSYYLYNKADNGPESEEFTVMKVIDGDTVIINDEHNSHVRYLGIDTPEIQIKDSPGEPMAKEATLFNKNLVEGKKVKLEFDEQLYDIYGRLLAYVYVDGFFVNQELLKEGLATVIIIEPNDMYSEEMYAALSEAKMNNKGLWGNLEELQNQNNLNKFLVDLDKANRYEGERIAVRGRITSSRKTEKVIVLNMEDKLDIVIFPDDSENFGHFGIDPENFYTGENIQVVGRVKMRRGKPGITINHPMLIRSLN